MSKSLRTFALQMMTLIQKSKYKNLPQTCPEKIGGHQNTKQHKYLVNSFLF